MIIIKTNLGNLVPLVRKQAAELSINIISILRNFEIEDKVNQISIILFEHLSEENPDVLASVLSGLKNIYRSNNILMISPSPREIIPKLIPLIKNKNPRVQVFKV